MCVFTTVAAKHVRFQREIIALSSMDAVGLFVLLDLQFQCPCIEGDELQRVQDVDMFFGFSMLSLSKFGLLLIVNAVLSDMCSLSLLHTGVFERRQIHDGCWIPF